MQSNKLKQGDGLVERLREALDEVFELIALKKAQEAALAAAAPAPPPQLTWEVVKACHDKASQRIMLGDFYMNLAFHLNRALAPPQDGQGAELLGFKRGNRTLEEKAQDDLHPPSKAEREVASATSSLNVGDEVWLRAKVMQFIEPEHNGVEILLEIGRNELMRTWCNASDLRRME